MFWTAAYRQGFRLPFLPYVSVQLLIQLHELVPRRAKVPRERNREVDRSRLPVAPLREAAAVCLDAAVHDADASCMRAFGAESIAISLW